ncbi:MAG: hypothetical protein KAQ85_08950 [Thermodesulfovibrionia bacterium]|nr:hypothetical protein [Thermodesulfovibrionia bacterium]
MKSKTSIDEAYEDEKKVREEKLGNFSYDGVTKLCRACVFEHWSKENFEGIQDKDPCKDCPHKEKEGI